MSKPPLHRGGIAQEPGIEIVIGSVDRLWEKDYGGRSMAPGEFRGFGEPGYAKLGMSLRVGPYCEGKSLLRSEARTVTTDAAAQRAFARYRGVIQPGVALVMRRALGRIPAQAEARRSARSGR